MPSIGAGQTGSSGREEGTFNGHMTDSNPQHHQHYGLCLNRSVSALGRRGWQELCAGTGVAQHTVELAALWEQRRSSPARAHPPLQIEESFARF
eukprot:2423817-Rhodomonas_salina.2